MTPYIQAERINLAGIPVLNFHARDLEGPAPTVLFYHGWTSRKEFLTTVAELLALHGMRVLLPDAPRHGEREPQVTFADLKGLWWPLIYETINEAGRLLRDAVAAGLTDPARVGVAGSSMGGTIAAGLMARYDWARAGVVLNGAPCYEWFDDWATAADGRPPMEANRRQELRHYDPERFIQTIAPRPLLMLHGEADTVVPIDGARRFRDLAVPSYFTRPERLDLQSFPGINHAVTIRMAEQMRSWFDQHLDV